MSVIFLPTGQSHMKLVHEATGRSVDLFVPGAANLDRSHLQEILQSEDESFTAECKAKGPKPERKHSRKEVGKALNEFRTYRIKRLSSAKEKIYF